MLNKARTDLALEAREVWQESADSTTKLRGVWAKELEVDGFTVSRVRVLDEEGEKALGKPIGSYTTVELRGISRRDIDSFPKAIKAVANELSELLPKGDGSVLVVGLGNEGITPDAVGKSTVEHIMVTRHLVEKFPDVFGYMRRVSAVTPGVLGMTGVESGEIIRGIAERIAPDFIIVIDALASMRLGRLCKTVQITDTGIVPGSGVGNARAAITKETMGIPVIAVGVPTVVNIATIVESFAEDSGIKIPSEALSEYSEKLLVTPKDIDVHIADMGRILGYAINTAIQKGISIEEMDEFLS
ncbi:MAG: GPR endopeptidase [Oscillospiraceae bacterium]|nr:GPR endopeptidase [Oscillospiraceae bacterium]MBQ7119526.1 GPR endopeptidase [Oscillospiraceae bacterium]